eukprot:scaffold3767_cov114-Isochrysis_galbana.AAC.34
MCVTSSTRCPLPGAAFGGAGALASAHSLGLGLKPLLVSTSALRFILRRTPAMAGGARKLAGTDLGSRPGERHAAVEM